MQDCASQDRWSLRFHDSMNYRWSNLIATIQEPSKNRRRRWDCWAGADYVFLSPSDIGQVIGYAATKSLDISRQKVPTACPNRMKEIHTGYYINSCALKDNYNFFGRFILFRYFSICSACCFFTSSELFKNDFTCLFPFLSLRDYVVFLRISRLGWQLFVSGVEAEDKEGDSKDKEPFCMAAPGGNHFNASGIPHWNWHAPSSPTVESFFSIPLLSDMDGDVDFKISRHVNTMGASYSAGFNLLPERISQRRSQRKSQRRSQRKSQRRNQSDLLTSAKDWGQKSRLKLALFCSGAGSVGTWPPLLWAERRVVHTSKVPSQ